MARVKDFKSKFNARKEAEKPKTVSKFSNYTESEAVEEIEEKAEISAPAPASDISKTTKKIKMAFSKANYEYLSNASENLGVSKSYIINRLIATLDSEAVSGFISNMLIPPSKDIVSRKKGAPLARINIIFNMDTHSVLSIEADKHNQTLTQYVNILLDFTRNK